MQQNSLGFGFRTIALAAALLGCIGGPAGAQQLPAASAPPTGLGGGPPMGPRPPDVVARSVPIDLALQMAKVIVASCKAFHVGISILDAAGLPKLTYIPDGTSASHAQTAFRKANAAFTFRMPSGQVAELAKTDAAVVEKVTANPGSFFVRAGGVPIMVGNDLIGAVGVSGAEPSAEDERCALDGIHKIQSRLK